MVLQQPIVVFINDDDILFFSTSANQREESDISFDDDYRIATDGEAYLLSEINEKIGD